VHVACPNQPITLHTRANALKRALRNIIENALRHARERVEIALFTLGTEGHEEICIIVDDDGPGIPPEQREYVFRPFARLDEARNLDDAGTGLGLSIARDVVQGHGGDIELLESPLGGLRVKICLPT
jgi:two-component system osmolarity sensor histidine kinase EnvZ